MKSYNLFYYFIMICLLYMACHREIPKWKAQRVVFHCDSTQYSNIHKDRLGFCYTAQKRMLDGQEYTLINMGISVSDSIGYFRKHRNKVYYLDCNSKEDYKSSNESCEYLLLEPNLKVGDTVSIFNPFVVSKIFIRLDGEHIYALKRIKSLQYMDEGCSMSGLVIGDITGFREFEYDCYPSGVLRFYADSIALDSIKLFL